MSMHAPGLGQDMEAAAPSDGGGRGQPLTLRYRGPASAIIGPAFASAVLTILTLTIYRFWGAAAHRRHLVGRTEINGEPMEYTGTGWEMFRGFLVLIFGMVLPVAGVLAAVYFFVPPLFFILLPVVYLAAAFLGLVAVYTARRYQFSRTTWRGVRFAMTGSATSFALACIGYGLLNAITLGWYSPASEMRLTRRLWSESRFGERAFKILLPDEGLAKPLYGPFAMLWFGFVIGYVVLIGLVTFASQASYYGGGPSPLIVVVAGLAFFLSLIWLASHYQVAVLKRTAELVGFDGARFQSTADAGSIFGLTITNLLIVALTLGFGQPFATARSIEYTLGRLKTSGTVDFDAILQSKARVPKGGEDLTDGVEMDDALDALSSLT